MAEHIFERLARERGIAVEEMRTIISARIEKGWNDSDPEKENSGEKYHAVVKFRHRTNGCDMRLRNCRKRDGRTCCGGIRIYRI